MLNSFFISDVVKLIIIVSLMIFDYQIFVGTFFYISFRVNSIELFQVFLIVINWKKSMSMCSRFSLVLLYIKLNSQYILD